MDLSFLSNKDVARPLEILHADTKKPIGVTFFVLPQTSAAVFEASSVFREKAIDDQIAEAMEEAAQKIAAQDGKEAQAELKAQRALSNRKVVQATVAGQSAAMVTGWESTNADWDANVGPYTKEKALEIFTAARTNKSASSIFEQVSAFAGKIENFTETPKPV
jgi:hypothetical protein